MDTNEMENLYTLSTENLQEPLTHKNKELPQIK